MKTKPLHRLLVQAIGLACLLGGLIAPASAVEVTVSLDWTSGFTAKDSSGNNLTTNSPTVQLGWFSNTTNSIASTVTRANLSTFLTTFASTNFLGIPVGSKNEYFFTGNNTTVDDFVLDADGNQIVDPITEAPIPTGNSPDTKTTLYMVITSGLSDLGIFKWVRNAAEYFFFPRGGDFQTDRYALQTQVGVTNSSSFNMLAVIGEVSASGLTLANKGGAVASAAPAITGAAMAAAFTTIYGTASNPQTFSVSGSNLTANLVATAPTGFEVSSDGSTYGNTATFSQSGGSASGTLRVRLAATAPVAGVYNSQNIVLSSADAASVNVATASTGNSVTAKTLTISGLVVANKNVDGTTTATVTGTPRYEGLVNNEIFSVTGSVTWAFPDSAVGANKTLSQTGSYGVPSGNYTVTQPILAASIWALPTLRLLTVGEPAYTNGNTVVTHSFSGNPGTTYVIERASTPSGPWLTNAAIVNSSTNFSVSFTNNATNSTTEWKSRMFFRVKNG
jgi:hypothetical protein